jgi:nucleoside 2-deoxyribosyltransferase
MDPMKRAVLAHHIRLQADAGREKEMWTTDRLDSFFASSPSLPTPAQQATNIIRLIGDATRSGDDFETLPASFGARVGSPSLRFAKRIISELKNKGLLEALISPTSSGELIIQGIRLTLDGWSVYEKERQGKIAGSYGFVALKFGDEILDPLLRDHIKPCVKAIGFELFDLRDVARAGVIDNLLRVQIRDAAFVLVDLTHENAGAYWEAGFAEGLGKPVLYLCERQKFEERKTHFDTNHCTTLLWNTKDLKTFKAELDATLRRSLNV